MRPSLSLCICHFYTSPSFNHHFVPLFFHELLAACVVLPTQKSSLERLMALLLLLLYTGTISVKILTQHNFTVETELLFADHLPRPQFVVQRNRISDMISTVMRRTVASAALCQHYFPHTMPNWLGSHFFRRSVWTPFKLPDPTQLCFPLF